METEYQQAHPIESKTLELLKEVLDPELGINIIDLGLIYEIHYNEYTGIKVLMTLTTPGCPMGDTIMENIEEVIKKEFPEQPLEVKLTWEPEWTPGFITEEGKKQLNYY
jgi:metal-sulfur cluster biosynthetic enzyme